MLYSRRIVPIGLCAFLLASAGFARGADPVDPVGATVAEMAQPHIVMLIAEPEYKTKETLPAFAKSDLEDFRVTIIQGEKDKNDLPGIEKVISDADVLLVSVRRRTLPAAQLEMIKQHVAAGKPVVGIRTASHAFSLKDKKDLAAGLALWQEFDADVLGGHYTGHHSNDTKTAIRVAPGAENHPILAGVDLKDFIGNGSLYRVNPIAKSATPLLIGTIPGKPDEPVAWTNKTSGGGTVFYTSLGHPDDFKSAAFRKLLKNGIMWTMAAKDKK